MTTFVPTNQIIGEYDNEQAIQFLQGGAGPGVPAGVLGGVCGGENVRAEQNTEESGDSSRQYLIHDEVGNSLKQCIWNIFEKSVQSQILF